MSNKLKILITNDDGFEAEGISVLREALSSVAEVYVLAPDSNRSGVSHHFVMDRNLVFHKTGDRSFNCSGFPADCVIAAVRSDIFENVKFDAVISGINKGPNMGTDCIYSGTVAAARQAVLYGIPGIAVSLRSRGHEYAEEGYVYEPLARFVAENLEKLISLYKPDCIININGQSGAEFEKARLTSLCIRDYNDKVKIIQKEDGSYESLFKGGALATTGADDNEYKTVKEGIVSIARLHAEPVNFVTGNQPDIKFNF